jgi:hypothetical protein
MLGDWLELFYLQAALPEQNYITPLPALNAGYSLNMGK